MKVVLSRKGFDSEFGSSPSPILPDGKMISLPIPSDKDYVKYCELKLADNKTYYDLIKELKIKGLDENSTCHLDPDIYKNILKRPDGWNPIFGQIGAAESHLRKQGIKEGDLFLFFGSFRKTKYENKEIVFDKSPEIHATFGYFQIGKIIKPYSENEKIENWMKNHPHIASDRIKNHLNTVYIARDNLSWNDKLPGAGAFYFDEKLVLTKNGLSKSKWNLPEIFRAVKISYHKNPWKNGYFQSASKGQEFVIEENDKIEKWVKDLIQNNYQ